MNSMPFRQLKSFLKILIGVQYEREKGRAAVRGAPLKKWDAQRMSYTLRARSSFTSPRSTLTRLIPAFRSK